MSLTQIQTVKNHFNCNKTPFYTTYSHNLKSIIKNMIYATTSEIQGKEIATTLGTVRGSTVRARNVGRDIFAGLKNLVGGEISEYTKLLADAREQAIRRMLDDAQRQGADAVVNVRFTTSQVMQGAAEMLAYGTAVKFK